MALTPAQLLPERTPMPTRTEAGRAFYASRVTLFFYAISGITLVFFLLHNLLEVLSGNLNIGQVLTLPLNHWHLAAVVVSGGFGLVTQRFELGVDALTVIEAGGSIAVLCCEYMMAISLLGVPAPRFDLVLTMVYVLFQMTRAVIVPSTVRRTLLVCALSALPLLFVGWLLAVRAPDAWTSGRTLYAPLYLALWCLDSAIPAALASSVIYGLRQQVRQAAQLGQYTLQERLGEGGMGTVYRAQHAMLRRPTAVKLLRPERSGEQALSRFEREVQLTSRLTHPNTVSIYDYGRTADGVFYYAMEYLDGLDLHRLVEREGAQDPARVVHLLSQVCRALNEAHGIGLIHRDIKPANIILCEHGGVPDVVKVVDFGLVKSLRGGGGVSDDLALSTANTIIGTPHFLPPEAIRSADAVDARSDLYALGAVGYFLLAGVQVFEGDSVLEICGHHLHTPPAPLSERMAPGRVVPPGLERVIMRCLAKTPADRPQRALDLLGELTTSGVPEWSETQARSWWARYRERGDLSEQVRREHLQQSPTLLEVDVRARARS